MMTPAIEKKTAIDEYRVTKPFWDGPRLLAVGDSLHLTNEQAKYRGDEVELVKPEAKSSRRTKDEPASAEADKGAVS